MNSWRIVLCFAVLCLACRVRSWRIADGPALLRAPRDEDPTSADQQHLRLNVCFSSDDGCDAGLSTQDLPVAVELRLPNGTWQELGDFTMNATVAAANSCCRYLIPLGPVGEFFSPGNPFQFRVIQREHAGSTCNCWRLLDVSVQRQNGAESLLTGDVCGQSGFEKVANGSSFNNFNFCGGLANTPRYVVSYPIRLSNGVDGECPPTTPPPLLDPPLCSPCNPPYLNVTFQLRINNNDDVSTCNRIDRFDEGVELAFRNAPGADWIPVQYFVASNVNMNNNDIGSYNEMQRTIAIRGYRVPVNISETPGVISVSVVISEVGPGVQLRWLQSVHTDDEPSLDVWGLDNVVISYVEDPTAPIVFKDDFESATSPDPVRWLPARNGAVVNSTAGCFHQNDGRTFVFGLSAPSVRDPRSRMVITTPLGLGDGQPDPSPTIAVLPSTTDTPLSTILTTSTSSTSSTTITSSQPASSSSEVPSTSESSSQPSTSEVLPSPSSLPPSSILPSPSPLPRTDAPDPPAPATTPPAPDSVAALEAQVLMQIQSNRNFAIILTLPPQEALEELEQLTDPSAASVDSLSAVYLLGDILSRLAPGEPVTAEFSQEVLKVASYIVDTSINSSDRRRKRESPSQQEEVAGSSLLRIMEDFLFSSHDFDGVFNVSSNNVELRAVTERSDMDGDDDVQGLEVDDHELNIDRGFIRALNSSQVQVGSLYYRDLTGLLPGNEAGEEGSLLVSPVLASSVRCPNERGCPSLPSPASAPASPLVTFRIAHSLELTAMLREAQGNRSTVCVFWEFEDDSVGLLAAGGWSRDDCWRNELLSNDTVTVCECSHLTNFAILLSPTGLNFSAPERIALEVIGYVGTIVSIVAMAFTVAAFLFMRSLWSMRSYIHIHLCINLSIAQLVFVAGVTPVGEGGVSPGCRAVAVLLHYFFLTTFMWMLMEGVVLYVVLVRVFVKHTLRYIFAFTVTSYGVPLLYLAAITLPIGFVLNPTPDYGYPEACWLNPVTGFVWSFIAPVVVIILVNIGFFVMSLVIMCKHHRRQTHKSRVAVVRHWIKAAVSLVLVMGLTWIIGLLVFNNDVFKRLAFIFTILFAFQGVVIFVLFVPLSGQVREAYSKWWKVKLANSDFYNKHFGDKSAANSSSAMQTVKTSIGGSTMDGQAPLTDSNIYTNPSSLSRDPVLPPPSSSSARNNSTFDVTYVTPEEGAESDQNGHAPHGPEKLTAL